MNNKPYSWAKKDDTKKKIFVGREKRNSKTNAAFWCIFGSIMRK